MKPTDYDKLVYEHTALLHRYEMQKQAFEKLVHEAHKYYEIATRTRDLLGLVIWSIGGRYVLLTEELSKTYLVDQLQPHIGVVMDIDEITENWILRTTYDSPGESTEEEIKH